MHALIENNIVTKYPYSTGELTLSNPNVSFPSSIPDSLLEEFGVFRVFFSTRPTVTSLQVAEEITPVFSIEDGRWTQVWAVRAKTEAELNAEMDNLKSSIVSDVQSRLDTFANSRNYDGILSACTYAGSTIPTFQSEGEYCVLARDTTWAALYQIMADVQSGARPAPANYAEIESELPALVWP